MKIAPRIHRIGSGIVNSYLVEESGEVTIIDAGLPSYWSDLPAELATMGRSLDDVRAVVLTHGLTEVATFGDGATLDVPGSPRASSSRAIRRDPRPCMWPRMTRCSRGMRSRRSR